MKVSIMIPRPGTEARGAFLKLGLDYEPGFVPGARERREIELASVACLEAWLANWKASNLAGRVK